jgi:hypothetical protein
MTMPPSLSVAWARPFQRRLKPKDIGCRRTRRIYNDIFYVINLMRDFSTFGFSSASFPPRQFGGKRDQV